MSFLRRLFFVAGFVTLGLTGASMAQDYPQRPVTLVVPFPAGGPTDIVARILAEELQTRLGGRFLVENRPGGSSAVGAGYVAHAEPDGHTLLMTTGSTMTINPFLFKQLPYSPDQFRSVSLIGAVPYLYLLRNDFPAQSIDEFIAAAKADPGRYTFATNGPGTSTHLIGALIMTSLGVELVDVPYAGAAPAMTDLIAGMVDSNIEALSVAVPNIAAGKYRALAAPVAERLPQLPDVPTFAELGYPDVVAENWFALFAPAETPDEIVTALHAAIAEISADEAYVQRMYDMGNPVRTSTPEELDALMVKEVDRWGGIIDAIGLEAQ